MAGGLFLLEHKGKIMSNSISTSSKASYLVIL